METALCKNQQLSPKQAALCHGEEKKRYVEDLFNRVAHRYDRMNTFISLGGTTRWRKKALSLVKIINEARVLDVGTGTGLIPVWFEKNRPDVSVDAVDVSEKMLEIAKLKAKKTNFSLQDATSLLVEDNTYDLVTSAYVLRNFHDRKKAIGEMVRVLKPRGQIMLLDSFSPKTNLFLSSLMTFWLKYLLPVIVFPFQKVSDYRYLASSILHSEPREKIVQMLTEFGVTKIQVHELEMGTVVCITGEK